MITATFQRPNPRPDLISFALFQSDQQAKPNMVFVAFEVPFDLPPHPAANQYTRGRFVA